ncbi:MAG: 50S ribosomal protein L18 [bacterium]
MKDKQKIKWAKLDRRHLRVRRKISGTAERPRLSVRRTLQHVNAQIVDDVSGRTIVQVSSTSKSLAAAGEGSLKMRRSEGVGVEVARLALEKGIKRVAFDRGGRLYHGRIKAVADAARKGGLEF